MIHSVKLDVYEGPLDLLLQLISRERVDVAEIRVAGVTEAYLEAAQALGEVDLETASSFLVLAATLLELKSLKLLPRRSPADPQIKLLLEERDRLLHRLIVYSTFKRAAAGVAGCMAGNAGFHSRAAELPEALLNAAPDVFRNLTPQMLARAAAPLLVPREAPAVDDSHVTSIGVSLEEMVEKLRDRMQQIRVSTFRELCRAATGRMEAVVSLLAVLELFRQRTIDMHQEQPFGDISIRWGPGSPVSA